jgi:ubiquitin C-terminal hydrolase
MGRLARSARSFARSEKFADDSGTTVDELSSDVHALALDTEPPMPAQPIRGLKNLGNSCYLNSVLQSLLAAEPFRLHLARDAVGGEGPTTTALRIWAKQMHNPGTGAVAPSKVLQAVCRRHKRFAGRNQQDAQEVCFDLPLPQPARVCFVLGLRCGFQ